MAKEASNGDQSAVTKPRPSPSPLRFSKFFQANLRILITGGAGFIGSHLVDRLMENERNEVIVVDNFFTGSKDNLRKWIGHPRFELIRHDVTETLLVEVDQIYHLACPASPIFYKYNPVKTIKTNVIGTLNMLGLAKRVGARILLTSTSEVYGDPLEHPQKEEYWGNVNPIGVPALSPSQDMCPCTMGELMLNRAANPEANMHTSGSVSFATHQSRLEVFDKTHKKKGTDQYISDRAREVAESYSQQMTEKYAGEEEQPQLDPEVWVAAFGAPKKGHVYGFGHNMDKSRVFSGTSSSASHTSAFTTAGTPGASPSEMRGFIRDEISGLESRLAQTMESCLGAVQAQLSQALSQAISQALS